MFTDRSRLTQSLSFHSCLQFQLSIERPLISQAFPVCSLYLTMSVLQLVLLTRTLKLFFHDQNIEAKRGRERDQSPAGLVSPGLPVIRKTVLHKPLFRENAVCSPTFFPREHPARLYFPGSFAIGWSHILSSGQLIGPGCSVRMQNPGDLQAPGGW